MNGFGMTFVLVHRGGRKEETAVCHMGNSKSIFLKANRRFFLPHTSTSKWCHPELILPDNYSKYHDKERMSEGSPTPVSDFVDHHWYFEYK
jgi:hypothetical protein